MAPGKSLCKPRRARHEKRRAAAAHELGIENEKRKAAEVVPVKVGEKNAVNGIGIDVKTAEGNHRRGAAVDEEPAFGVSYEDAALEPTAAAEGIAAAQKPDLNRRMGLRHIHPQGTRDQGVKEVSECLSV